MGSDNRAEDVPPSYGDYQTEIYSRGLLQGSLPPLTTDPNKLRLQAKKVMRDEAYNYITGGAGEGATMDANRLAFRQWKIVPRMMRPTVPRDLSVSLFGERYDSPVLLAPVGVQEVYHGDKELGTAAACAELNVPFIMSTASTSSIQDVAAASGDHPRWFQLYWPMDDEITASILSTAKAAGFKALVVTVDTATMSWRPADLDTAFIPFMKGQGNTVGFTDPVFRRKFAEMSDGSTPEENPLLAARYWLSEAFSGDSHPWEHLAIIRKHWDGPILLKGIQHPEDALLALQHGAAGIVVSNHGGRQVDGAVASLDMLPEIVEAVGDKMTVLFDSGIRTGADIVKALALGAKAVLVGRPVMYGLGIAGKAGAKHVLASLLADLDGTMGLAGIKSVADLNPASLKRVSYGGDVKSSL
ncbi:putative fmn-dependent dehydrogenase [Rosellinia necatrix]|uniref:Putative fmn-dependent dehydrogenase n=1 Tax=Rosellinia necatrix TaxID=77044 RepID=A0A1W2TPH3_ROSNE|nr:putative fmn-dependent dehydrogenase [Rosellinia necatrix]